MLVDRKIIFDAVKQLRGGKAYTPADVKFLDVAIDLATSTLAPLSPAPPAPIPPRYTLSQTSVDRLHNVKMQLRLCVLDAIKISLVDFGVSQGERSLADQKIAVATGHSRTMKSKHLLQLDGSVWAVDLVAYNKGVVSWEFPLYAAIAYAMDQAATAQGIANHIRWGCAWDRVLSDFGGSDAAYLAEAKAYAARHAGSDLLDAPHFEWVP
jgi:peptidoglycan L-alanyl-D-glutamate endopeptidase CwlK